jgi:hypothetical protein
VTTTEDYVGMTSPTAYDRDDHRRIALTFALESGKLFAQNKRAGADYLMAQAQLHATLALSVEVPQW